MNSVSCGRLFSCSLKLERVSDFAWVKSMIACQRCSPAISLFHSWTLFSSLSGSSFTPARLKNTCIFQYAVGAIVCNSLRAWDSGWPACKWWLDIYAGLDYLGMLISRASDHIVKRSWTVLPKFQMLQFHTHIHYSQSLGCWSWTSMYQLCMLVLCY